MGRIILLVISLILLVFSLWYEKGKEKPALEFGHRQINRAKGIWPFHKSKNPAPEKESNLHEECVIDVDATRQAFEANGWRVKE